MPVGPVPTKVPVENTFEGKLNLSNFTVEDLDTRAGPMPRLSILKQESTNAANDQLTLSNHTSRVITLIDPTRIPAVIESY